MMPEEYGQDLPAAPEAETLILGHILEGQASPGLIGQLEVDDFADLRNRRIFEAVASAATHGLPLDIVTIADRLGPALAEVGGAQYLTKLLDAVPSAALVRAEERIQILREARTRRQLLTAAAGLTRAARNGGDPLAAVAELELLLARVRRTAPGTRRLLDDSEIEESTETRIIVLSPHAPASRVRAGSASPRASARCEP